jgi:MoxR-like ATPase
MTSTPRSHVPASSGDVELLERLASARKDLLTQVGQRIVGQRDVLDGILTAIFSGGHALLVGVPGLAKTLMVQTVAEALDLAFNRIQFTPDLMPSDITGTEIIEEDLATGKRGFRFVRGPVFANIVLADEINRTPPKTQAALLQAMQEHQVSAAGQTHHLPGPFFVLATQNPIEQEGTYPLPEAQLDRFLLKVKVEYPARLEEREVLVRMSGGEPIPVHRILEPAGILTARRQIAAVHIDPRLVDYIIDLVRATREPGMVGLTELGPLIAFGASPRASIALAQAARAYAFLQGRAFVVPEDVRALAPDVLRHRLVLTFEAEAEDVTADGIVAQLLGTVKAP